MFASSQEVTEAQGLGEFSELNEPSKEYLQRLSYLVRERRLLTRAALEIIIASDEPINPLVATTMSAALYPHQTAFSQLLSEDLQWPLIREAAKQIMSLDGQEKQRQETTARVTKEVLGPLSVRALHYRMLKTLHLPGRRVLGVSAALRSSSDNTIRTTLRTFDLLTGAEVMSTTVDGEANLSGLEVANVGQTAVAVFLTRKSSELVTVDLLSGELMSRPKIAYHEGPPSANLDRSTPLLFNHNGALRALVFDDDKAPLIDPLLGVEKGGFLIDEQPPFRAAGLVGNRIFVSGYNGDTYCLLPSRKGPTQTIPNFIALSSLQVQGEDVLFGLKRESANRVWVPMALHFMKSGLESKELRIQFGIKDPEVVDVFESQGVTYAIIANDKEVLLVDLLKGKVKRRDADGPFAGRLKANWGSNENGRVAFDYKGRRYMAALLKGVDESDPQQLVLIDALTLEPVGAPLAFLNKTIESLRGVINDDGNLRILVNLSDGTSQIVSMVNQI